MKKAFSFRAPMGVFLVFTLLAIIGCRTTQPPMEEIDSGDNGNGFTNGTDIWSLLQRGDSRARDYFIGEVEVNARDPFGKTPLHYAAERSDAQLAAFFITLGANTNVLDNENQSPLGISVERNDARIAELLVNANANIHMPIRGNTTAARLALSRSGAVLRAIITPSTIESTDNQGRTILHLASIDGNIQAVNDILARMSSVGTSINKVDNDQKNALDYSLARPDSKNHMEIAEQLILSGSNSENPIFYFLAPAVRSANYNIRRSDGLTPIHFAVRDNHLGLVNFLMERNVDINIKSASGSTALHEAARAGNLQIMALLIQNGADVNAADAKGNTPLHTGIPANVHKEALSLLLNNEGNPNLRDEHGDTPLHIVIILNRAPDIVQTLLGGGSDVHIRNIHGQTPLYTAIQEKRTDLIPLLLSYGAEVFAADNTGVTPFHLSLRDTGNIFDLIVTAETVNQRDTLGNTMLHAAVRNRGIPRHIGIILDHRVQIDARNREGDTALHIVVRTNQRQNGEFLISRGANIFVVNSVGESPLYLALTAPTGIRTWMINSSTIIAKDSVGNNMLHYASQWNLDSAIPVIIQRGISVEEKNSTGETPLFMATRTNSPSTIRVLLDNHANLNTNDNQGNTLLHTAVRWNAVNSAALLISSGIDINAHSLNGDTALHNAVTLGMSEIETMLINRGASLEVRDIDGNTPFMEAVRTGLISSIGRLAANGADISTRNIRGDTPLHIAVTMERYDIVNILLNMGASIHASNTRNRTPFRNSISISPRMVSGLLTRERINLSDDMGNSALHIAIQERASNEIIVAILSRGVRINAVDHNGQTPLRIAIDLGLLGSAKILADAGADPFLMAVDNKSPSDIAFSKGDDYIRALFSGGAIQARDNSANTILHYAARFGTPQIITTLIELGANKSLRNTSSELPVDIALRWNRMEIAEMLR